MVQPRPPDEANSAEEDGYLLVPGVSNLMDCSESEIPETDLPVWPLPKLMPFDAGTRSVAVDDPAFAKPSSPALQCQNLGRELLDMQSVDRLYRIVDCARAGIRAQTNTFGANYRDVLDADMGQHALKIGDRVLKESGRAFP